MARHESSGDLTGHLAASLTPRVTQVPAPARNAQSSGLFDVTALYAEALGQVMRRASDDPRLAPLARARDASWLRGSPEVSVPWPPPAYERAFERDVPVPFEFDAALAAPRSRGRGLGWFGIAVAWLATVTLAAGLAIGVPAHVVSRPHVIVAESAAVVAADTQRAVAHVEPPSPVTASAPSDVVGAPGRASDAAAVGDLAAAAWTPRAAVSAPSSAAANKGQTAVGQVRAPRTKPAVTLAAAVVTTPSRAGAAEPASPRVAAPTSTVAAKPAGATTVGMSLEDLIRREVQAESAKPRH